MLDVQREQLPQAYLLILSRPATSSADAGALIRALHRASRTNKPAVVVDLSLVDALCDNVVELLLAYAFVLQTQQRHLILCHVPQPDRHRFQRLNAASQPLLAASVLEAKQEIDLLVNASPLAAR